MSIKHNLEQWIAQLDYDDTCDISDRQVSELIRGYCALEAKCAALTAENAGLKAAAEFATAPDMWEELGGNVMRYQYQEWYADKLKSAIQTPCTDTFLAEVRASTLEDLAKKKRDEKMSLHPDTFALGSVIAALDMQANELEDLAAQLRQEAAQ